MTVDLTAGLAGLAVALTSFAGARAAEPRCGNGVVEAGEDCDLGIGNEVGRQCTMRCVRPRCGDAIVDVDEACDDGNLVDRDGCSSSCTDESRPLWISTFDSGAPGGEWFGAVAATPDGLVAVGDRSWSWPATAPLVVGFDREGRRRFEDLLWSGPGPGTASAVAAIDGDGDGVVVGGSVADLGAVEHPAIWRYEADGTRRYAIELEGLGGSGTITAVVALAPDRVIVGGVHNPAVGGETGWIGELDARDGTLRWLTSLADRQRLYDLALAPDGSLVGTGYSTATGSKIWVGSFELDGSPRWVHIVAPEHYDYWNRGASVVAAADGSIYAVGWAALGVHEATSSIENEIWLGAFEADGTPRWTRTQRGPEGTSSYASDVVLDAAGRPLVVGTIRTQPLLVSTSWDLDVWLRQYDRDGEVAWTWTYDGPLHLSDYGSAALFTEQGTLVIAGSTAERRQGGNAWLAELDPWFASAGRSAAPVSAAPAPPPSVLRQLDASPAALDERGPHRATLHLDFDGGTLRPGDRGSLREVPCVQSPLTLPGLALDEQSVQSIADRVAAAMSPYGVDVRVDAALPRHLPRTTVMVGGLAEQLGLDPAVAGFACVVDCGDRWSSDLALAFVRDLPSIANNVLHEAAHTWGLDHVVAQDQLMYPLGATYDATWGSGCIALSEDTTAPRCLAEHERWCPAGQQDSHAELLAAFGAAAVDLEAPHVEIVAPPTGHTLALGEPLVLELRVEDEDGDPGHRIVVPELEWERVAHHGETQLELALPPGVFTVRVEAIDHAGNESAAAIEVVVGEPPPRVPSDDEPGPDDVDPGRYPLGLDDDGGCRIAGRGEHEWLTLFSMMMLLGVRRRR